ncbi:MAG TPA: hypothetical protein VGN86_12370 [Pyrinomonadaceae bacterium]|jgi:uncharacterized iron-regulated membrane protein|nr:hypothetical protein [Pyrinomonadaceae bacterium]
MRKLIYQTHIWLGLVVAIPVLAWTSSGLLYALPSAVEGGKVERISPIAVRIAPAEAITKANEFSGKQLPITALTLLMRKGRPVYQAIGGMGADSLLIDAETGAVILTPPPGPLTRYFRQAHFYFFAGNWQVPMLILFSALAFLSALSGIYLNLTLWLRKMKHVN